MWRRRGPVGHVVVVHRGAPAEDVVADEEARQDADGDRDEGDAGERRQLAVELTEVTGPDFDSAAWIRS